MIAATVPTVYLTDWAAHDPRSQERIERLAAAMGHPQPQVVCAAELSQLAVEHGWCDEGGRRTGYLRQARQPFVVLNAYETDEAALRERLERYPALRPWMLAGQEMVTLRDSSWHRGHEDGVCQTAPELHCAYGCFHACDYCHVGTVFNIMTNLEALVERLPEFWAAYPQCRLWKFDNYTDTITLEPEYGASALMVEAFARQQDHFVLLYTKSDNVGHLMDLQPRGQTLISWSLAGPRASRSIEKLTPPVEDRIAAMARCQAAGYRVRARISPICPLEGWREEAVTLLETLFAQARPEVISMDVLGWMNAAQMTESLDVAQFEDRFRQDVEKRLELPPPDHRKHVFPHEWRREIMEFYLAQIRRLSPDTPVSLCMETGHMWHDMGPALGMEPGSYACCCGPDSVPGHRHLCAAEG